MKDVVDSIKFLNDCLREGVIINTDLFPPITGVVNFKSICESLVFTEHENKSLRTPYFIRYEIKVNGERLLYTKNYSEAIEYAANTLKSILKKV